MYGFKPTFGAVPQRGYVDRVGEAQYDVDANHFGPIARSVDDLAIAYQIIAFHPGLGAEPHTSLADYRIGAWLDDDACPVDAQVLIGCNARRATTDAASGGLTRRVPLRACSTHAHFSVRLAHCLRGPAPMPSRRDALPMRGPFVRTHDVMFGPSHDHRAAPRRSRSPSGASPSMGRVAALRPSLDRP